VGARVKSVDGAVQSGGGHGAANGPPAPAGLPLASPGRYPAAMSRAPIVAGDGDYAVTTAGGGKATLHVVAGGDPGP